MRRHAIGVFVSKKLTNQQSMLLAAELVDSKFAKKHMGNTKYDVFVIGNSELPQMMFNQTVLKGLLKKAKQRDKKK